MKTKLKRAVSKRVQAGPNTTVPIRKEAHKVASIARAHAGQSMVEFVSAAVVAAAGRVAA